MMVRYSILLWILDMLSRIGVHHVGALKRIIVMFSVGVAHKQTTYTLHHVEGKIGLLYVEQKGGALGGMVISQDYKTNGSLEEPIYKIQKYPSRCLKTYAYCIEHYDEQEYADLIDMMVFGVIPVVMQQCKSHIEKQLSDMMGI